MRTIQRDIAGAYIFSNDGHILLGKNEKGGVYQDLWIVPSGGVDEGETKFEAAKREVMEEVGIDISGAQVDEIDKILHGKSEKTFKETGETAIVDMTFYAFKVSLESPAQEIKISLNDDLSEARWVPIDLLPDYNYSPSIETMLRYLGCLK